MSKKAQHSHLFVKPAREGLLVRDPVTMRPLAADGEAKPRNSFWLRRLRDGDVEETKPPRKAKPAAKPEKEDNGGK